MKTKSLLMLCVVLLTAGCEKAYEEDVKTKDGKANVHLRVSNLNMLPFDDVTVTKAFQPISQLSTRLTFAFFADGTKVKTIHQDASQNDFGSVSLSLDPGSYDVAIIAYTANKNLSIPSLDKITFPDNHVSDTFYCYGELVVNNETVEEEVELDRAVAMFRLKTTDEIPYDVSQMKFYYTGGSSTFDATTGYGCVNSRQTELITVTDDMVGKPGTFEVYTFPRSDSNKLTMTVTAIDNVGGTYMEKKFENVGIECNMITEYQGSFFNSSQWDDVFNIVADPQWQGTQTHSY